MRDLTRPNALHPAWKKLSDAGFTVYTPMTWSIIEHGKKKSREQRPLIHDLLFVKAEKNELDRIVACIPTLQYRFKKGGHYCEPIVVNTADMDRFIKATACDSNPLYYAVDELTSNMIGKKVTIMDGPMSGISGYLLSIRGMRKKRLIIEIPGFIAAGVEVNPDYIKLEKGSTSKTTNTTD